MASDVSPEPRSGGAQIAVAELAGLDALDLADGSRGAGSLAQRIWRSLWPKLAAIALVGISWELLYLAHYKHYVFPGPGPTMVALGDQAKTALLWPAIGTTTERALIGFALATLIGSVIGALVSRIAPLRAAVGSLITGPQTIPRSPGSRSRSSCSGSTRRRSCSSSCSGPRRRSPTG